MMIKSKGQSDSNDWEETTRSLRSPKRKYFKMNFMDNSLCEGLDQSPKEQEKVREYIEETLKDNERYNQIKNTIKKKFFNIRTARERALNKPPKLDYLPLQQPKQTYASELLRPTTTQQIRRRSQIKDQVQNILDYSHNIKRQGFRSHEGKVRTGSYLDKKNKKIIDEEKHMIKEIIRKSDSYQMPERKWESLTNKQKFLMDYLTYQKKKSLKEIEKDVYERKIRKKTKELEKFQDFILEEVKFSSDHKQKLSKFFNQIRYEFKRIQTHRDH